MPPESILGGINQEATQLELLGNITLLLVSMLERMPRTTGNDQCAVSVEGGTVAVSSLPTLGTVTTVGTVSTVTTMNQLGGRAALPVADAQLMTGTSHIYNNIIVS